VAYLLPPTTFYLEKGEDNIGERGETGHGGLGHGYGVGRGPQPPCRAHDKGGSMASWPRPWPWPVRSTGARIEKKRKVGREREGARREGKWRSRAPGDEGKGEGLSGGVGLRQHGKKRRRKMKNNRGCSREKKTLAGDEEKSID
jgi:hypothetical protein